MKPFVSECFLKDDTIEALKKALDKSPDADMAIARPHTDIFGVSIVCENDPTTRKCLAIAHSATTGKPVIYEDENGNFIEVAMPNPYGYPFDDIGPIWSVDLEEKK